MIDVVTTASFDARRLIVVPPFGVRSGRFGSSRFTQERS